MSYSGWIETEGFARIDTRNPPKPVHPIRAWWMRMFSNIRRVW